MTNKTILEAQAECLMDFCDILQPLIESADSNHEFERREYLKEARSIADQMRMDLRAQAAAEQPTKEALKHIHTWMPYFKGTLQTGWVCAICDERKTEGDFTPQTAEQPEKEGEDVSEVISDAADALKFLATNVRPIGGEDRYNSIHLETMALSLKAAALIVHMQASAHHSDSGEWRKIETAPKDENIIIFAAPDWVGEARLDQEDDTWVWKWAGGARVHSMHIPTLWRPLPLPPKE